MICIMVLFSHSVLGYNLQLLSVRMILWNGSSTTILWNGSSTNITEKFITETRFYCTVTWMLLQRCKFPQLSPQLRHRNEFRPPDPPMDGRDSILLLCRVEYITDPLVSVKKNSSLPISFSRTRPTLGDKADSAGAKGDGAVAALGAAAAVLLLIQVVFSISNGLIFN